MRHLFKSSPFHQSLHNVISRRWFHESSVLKFSSSSSSSLSITIPAAIDLLNLSHKHHYSSRDLRDAYFTAAKTCHPDSRQKKDKSEEELTDEFYRISDAYELLLKHKPSGGGGGDGGSAINNYNKARQDTDLSHIISKTEEQQFRENCREFLGIDAEIVEESKRCPLFREWLKGRNVDAYHWNMFLMKNGGLAPMLRKKKTLTLGENKDKSATRRRRR